jgi:formylglycine-generating enzyme required for sulfatase activity
MAENAAIDLTAGGFRLPTDAQWEYAARGGNPGGSRWGYAYAGSNNVDAVAVYYDGSPPSTAPVKTKAPNGLGFYDMSGNADEWCQGTPYSYYRSLRGGAWAYDASYVTVNSYNNSSPSNYNSYCGFRVACN